MDYKQYEDLKYMLCEELEKIVDKGELTAGSLETVHKLTDTIKNVGKIEMMEDGEYSEAGEWNAGGTYAMRDDGSSYRNGGSSYRRGGSSYRNDNRSYRNDNSSYRRGRDSMGRFTSRAGAKDEMMMKLEEMMQEANEKERGILERAMKQLENA